VLDPKTAGCPAKLTIFQGERVYDGGRGKAARIVSARREAEVHGKLPGPVLKKPIQWVYTARGSRHVTAVAYQRLAKALRPTR